VSPARPGLALTARAFTLSRIAVLPAFLWLLDRVAADEGALLASLLIGTYLVLALSDYVDGPLARRAGAASEAWGRIDVTADVAFNLGSLALAAHLGLVRPWTPVAVAVLGGRFLWRIVRQAGPGVEDRAGKLAGVFYYLLVGVVVSEVALGFPGRLAVQWAGDAVFLYSLFVLLRGMR
jgi:phosphatidylglycerophosphate synthase